MPDEDALFAYLKLTGILVGRKFPVVFKLRIRIMKITEFLNMDSKCKAEKGNYSKRLENSGSI